MTYLPATMFRQDSGGTSIDPVARLKEIYGQWDLNPGRAIGGTGNTGLQSQDGQGWSKMLEEQQEALKIEDYLKGGKGITVKTAPFQEHHLGSGIPQASGMPNPYAVAQNAWAPTPPGAMQGLHGALTPQPGDMGPGYQSHEEFMRGLLSQYGPKPSGRV